MATPFAIRPADDADPARIIALTCDAPAAIRHLIDLPWRLSASALTFAADARCCVASDGSLLGFAAWQAPWAALDMLIRPGPGYTIRPLAGAAELDDYVALHRAAFGSHSMTSAWRRRALGMPTYRLDLDLVAVAPDGGLAGFCVGWLDSARRVGQVEPIGTHPAHQRRGLGRALLDEMFRRFAAHGAVTAIVETENVRSPAQGLYASAGFQPTHRVLRKGTYVKA